MENNIYTHYDTEVEVIACMVQDKSYYIENKYSISQDLFDTITCRDIVKQFEIDPNNVTINRLHLLKMINDDAVDYFESIYPDKQKFSQMIKFLTSLRARREVLEAIKDLTTKNLNHQDLEQEANLLMNKINGIISKSNISKLNIVNNEKFMDILQKSMTQEVETLSSFIPDLDNRYQLTRNNLVVLAANAGIGKTYLALNMYTTAIKSGFNAIFFTTEMSDKQIAKRIAGIYADEDLSNNQSITHNGLDKVFAEVSISDHNIVNIERLTLADIRKYMIELRDRKGSVDYVYIDYLTRMQLPTIYKDYRLNVGYVAQELKSMAKEFDCMIILLAQLSRANYQRSNKRPIISDLAESATIEREADSVVLLYKEEDFRDKGTAIPAEIKNVMEIEVAKNRHGKTCSDLVYFANSGKIASLNIECKVAYQQALKSKIKQTGDK